MKLQFNDDVYTRDEAAEKLGVDPTRVTRMFDAGILNGFRIGEGRRCSLFITKASVQARIDNPGKSGVHRKKKEKTP